MRPSLMTESSAAYISNVYRHQMVSRKLVSLVSQPAILRVSLCEAHTDWPSAQNQLTASLIIFGPSSTFPPPHTHTLGICGLVPNLPWYHLFFIYLLFFPLSLYVYPFLFTDTKDLIQDCSVSHFCISLHLHKVMCLRPKSASEHANSLYTRRVKGHTCAPRH